MLQEEWKWKHQKEPIQGSKQGPKHSAGPLKVVPKSSARPVEQTAWKNHILHDWMTVYVYVDTFPTPINQRKVVQYFATRPEGALVFTQSTLSHKLQHHLEMEAHVHTIPNAL